MPVSASEMASRFRKLAQALRNDAPALLAETALDLVRDGFDRSANPYGEPWAPITHRDGKILIDTATLQNSWHVARVGRTSFGIAAGVNYARYHQEGTRYMPARKMLPDDGDAMPPAWEAAFKADLDALTQEILLQ